MRQHIAEGGKAALSGAQLPQHRRRLKSHGAPLVRVRVFP